jgi:hypothetical protein
MPKFYFDLSDEEFESHVRYEKALPKNWVLFVFDRDNWSCRRCNGEENIHPHHYVYRSLGRDHHPDNLVTLCDHCHRRVHDGLVWILVENGNFFFGGSRVDLYNNLR